MEKVKVKKIIQGNRVTLKKHSLDLALTMFTYVSEDRERLDRFLPWVEYIQTEEDEKDYILSTHKRWDECSYFDYGIFLDGETYIGNIGVHSIKWKYNVAELGYWILGKYEGQGLMTEAVKELEQYLFSMGFNRIQIRCSDLNERSAGVPVRCGYTYEGTARQDCIEKGQYRNTKTFSKLLHET